MKKVFLILSISLLFSIAANAETSKNKQPYHPLGCGITYPCPEGSFTDSAKEVGHYDDNYHTVKNSVIEINGELYSVLEYSNGKKAIKKGQYWIK